MKTDLIVIGAAGGYETALEAAKSGRSVTLLMVELLGALALMRDASRRNAL